MREWKKDRTLSIEARSVVRAQEETDNIPRGFNLFPASFFLPAHHRNSHALPPSPF